MRPPLLQQVGGVFEDGRAPVCRRPAPGFEPLARRGDCRIRIGRRRIGDASRRGGGLRGDRCNQFIQRRAIAEFDAARIRTLRLIEIARQTDVRMPRVAGGADDIGRPPQQRRDRHGVVGGDRHERRIGAILQQAPHQIRQQIAVAADRRIGATGDLGTILAQLRVQRFAHAVQALKLESACPIRKLEHGRHRQRVVGGELREDARPQRQQLLRAGDVVQVGHRLAGEHRIVVEAALLRALDLGVPVGALHQPQHHPPVQRARQLVAVADHGFRALLIGLDREAKTVPAFERCVAERRRDHLQRQFQPVGFLGIDGEIQIKVPGMAREVDQPRHQFRHHPLPAHRLEARMQRRELYGDAGPLGQGTVIRGAADGLDRAGVGIEIALGIGGGARAFAEHVEGIAGGVSRMRPLESGLDGLAQHKVAAHQPHRLPCGGAHRRRAEPFCQSSDGALRGFAGLNHPRRHPERPGGSVDQEGAGFGLVMDKIALAELVLDELVGGARIRHAQQRFRQHHQRQALFGGEREFAQHVLDAAEPVVIGPDGPDQARRGAVDPTVLFRAQPGAWRAAGPRWRRRRRRKALRRAEGVGRRAAWRFLRAYPNLARSRP